MHRTECNNAIEARTFVERYIRFYPDSTIPFRNDTDINDTTSMLISYGNCKVDLLSNNIQQASLNGIIAKEQIPICTH